VPDQDPERVIAAIERHVTAHCPPGVTIAVRPTAGSARAYAIDPDNPALIAAREALRASYGLDPLMIRLGGTLPVAEFFKTDLWEMPDETLHGPNEVLRLENFDRGLRVYADLLLRLSGAAGG
jgi:acetylornithine deacetylase/succinyl-diaminopimelate desuccinylase-like protein